MTIELPKDATAKQVQEALKKLEKSLKKKNGAGNIARHFGVCKDSKVDGLKFQKKVRSEWD